MTHEIVYEVIPFAYPMNTGGWRPAYHLVVNGQFDGTFVFELTFEEARFALPYARMLAKQELQMRQLLTQRFSEERGK